MNKEATNKEQEIIGAGFYLHAKPGTFSKSEWLDMLIACQDGRITCLRASEIIEREMELQTRPKKHLYWGAGEPGCPETIRASNGELHTLKCKVCGQENPKDACGHTKAIPN